MSYSFTKVFVRLVSAMSAYVSGIKNAVRKAIPIAT